MNKTILTSLFVAVALLPKEVFASFPAGANNIASAPDVILAEEASNPTDLFNCNFETNETSHDFENASNPGNRSAWWKWTPTENGFCTVDTIISSAFGGSTPLRDTVVGVYSLTNPSAAVSVTNLTQRASNNNLGDAYLTSDSGFSKTTFYAKAGTIYYIAVDGGYGSAVTSTARTVSIRVRQVPALAVTRRGLWEFDSEVLGRRGAITLTTTSTGAYSAIFMIGAAKYNLAGHFDIDGTSVRSIPRPTAAGVTPLAPITIKLDASQASYLEVWMDGQRVKRRMERQSVFPRTSPAVLAATYNIASRNGGGSGDPGRGYLRTTVSPTGVVNMVGVTYDGTKVTGASALCLKYNGTDEYEAPAFVLLHGNKGCIAFDSYMEVSNNPARHYCSVYVDFIRPAATSATVTFLPGGLYGAEYMDGIPYVKPAIGARVLNFLTPNNGLGTLTMFNSSGELAATVQEGLTLSTANKTTFISTVRKPTLTINTSTGIVTGSITTTDTILGVTKPRVRSLVGLVFNDAYTVGSSYLTGYATGVTKNLMFEVKPAVVIP